MIRIRNDGRRPLMLDSTVKILVRTKRPPVPGAYERLEHGDVLEIEASHDIELIVSDGILAVRGV